MRDFREDRTKPTNRTGRQTNQTAAEGRFSQLDAFEMLLFRAMQLAPIVALLPPIIEIVYWFVFVRTSTSILYIR